MRPAKRVLLVPRVVWELLRYDLVIAISGFKGVARRTGAIRPCCVSSSDLQQAVLQVIAGVLSFYWRPVHCLQRAVVTARILRQCGIDGQVVIGCRAVPVECHAWVEVNGRVVNDSAGYQQKFRVLERF